ncbi:hypothetical protein [Periweissella beninensis]|uniref:Uncharacterized protein n=1 Tax=Periweissella beninensis TaxID=504936 RepID=A0ABT0VJV0_9LACO|nr:hypothetical protein [Periweissella beninensis]MBM7543692.1 hypothetical protein [Periweissella beninensis]MCM2436672.1 hypothetical protein [Periweissella beninensis]
MVDTGVKIFNGKYLEELVVEMDEWLELNHASLYGQGAIRQRKLADETYEVTVKYVFNK